jgi:ATP-binding cassette subfamily F protein 3
MILLELRDVAKYFGPEPVLDGVSLEVRPGERLALVGPNGAGKTTLLKIAAGLVEPDRGHVQKHPSITVGYLDQHPNFSPDRTIWDEAASALAALADLTQHLEALAQAMAHEQEEAERRRLAERYEQVQYEVDHQDAYNLEYRVERVLRGLGFSPSSFTQPASTLSGGQQNRLLLAKLLLAEPDLMLLDEPSNHLDLEATAWLEEYLLNTRQALWIVSHDRYLLDRVTTRTLELYQGTVESYPGNYTQYQRQKAQRLAVQQRTYERQQEEIARLEDFIRRNQYGQRHQQALDRRKKIERIERVAPPRTIQAPPMAFPPATRSGDVVIRLTRLGKSFPGKRLFRDLSLDVLRGEKWGILGPNGCGKTTLLRCMVGELTPDEGQVVVGSGVRIGYYDQGLGGLDPHAPVLDAVRPPGRELVEQQRRDLLARFGITGSMVFQPTGRLSGGERSRVALARLAALEANVLVLDEPTNHLDLWARESLETALRAFDGSVLFVSHDRYFINRVADKLLVMEGEGHFRVVPGNYETYQHLARQGWAGQARPGGSADNALLAGRRDEPQRPPPRTSEPEKPRRKRKFPYRKVADLEAEIAQREARLEEIHALFAREDVLRDGAQVKALQAELAEQQAALARLYEHWEEACELGG